VDEIQHILTDAVFIDRGRIRLDSSLEDIERRYTELTVRADGLGAARNLKPIHERQVFDRSYLIFEDVERAKLNPLGETRTPSLADLFIATMQPAGAGRDA
jgi:ABC-2 type transport system ATP-binding protein